MPGHEVCVLKALGRDDRDLQPAVEHLEAEGLEAVAGFIKFNQLQHKRLDENSK